jgi:Ca2+ transporting ATPase
MSELVFDLTTNELRDLMQMKVEEFKQKVTHVYGGSRGVAKKLKTNTTNGLQNNPDEMNKRQEVFGKNEIPPKPPKSIFRLAFEAFQDKILILLMICAVISIGLSFYHPAPEAKDEEFRNTSVDIGNLEWVEGVAIMIAVIVVVSVSSFNDWRKERQFRGLQDRIALDNKASVVRDGQVIEVHVKELVVGDLCCIKYGDLIPADGIVVQASDLKIDESSLTGETDLIKKNETDSMNLFSGKKIMKRIFGPIDDSLILVPKEPM